jgi:N-carbamoylputrescine amidase
MTRLNVAALQLAFTDDIDENIKNVSALVREAAAGGAKVVLPPELFEGLYFCRTEDEALFANARPLDSHPAVLAMRKLAVELAIHIPTSFFEADGPHFYNSLAMIDDKGAVMGVYRKSHIPDGPGYSEKFYFRPGNSGFKTWPIPAATLGVGICWDQWYPETARALMLMGAEILLFPTAIGTEPYDPDLDTSLMWRRAMIGHAVSNVVPVVAANRIGDECGQIFYGHSFICDERGEILAELGATETGVIAATLDLDAARRHRAGFGFFRDRRPDLYGRLVEDI